MVDLFTPLFTPEPFSGHARESNFQEVPAAQAQVQRAVSRLSAKPPKADIKSVDAKTPQQTAFIRHTVRGQCGPRARPGGMMSH